MTIIQGVIHGRTIELQEEPGLRDGQAVTVTIRRIEHSSSERGTPDIPGVDSWMNRLVFDPTLGERIVAGTRLTAEALVAELEQGRSNDEMTRVHPELCNDDLEALRRYAEAPVGLRRSFHAWSVDAEELDKYVEWTRQRRKIKRREVQDWAFQGQRRWRMEPHEYAPAPDEVLRGLLGTGDMN